MTFSEDALAATLERRKRLPKSFVKNCPRCRDGHETYVYMYRRYEFDVDRARQIVKDGREPMEVEEDSVRASVENSRIHKPHLDHVNMAEPGIIAHLYYPSKQGERIQAHLLIDGNHRAARCLRDGLPFCAYILSEEESEAILLRSPDRPESQEGLLDDPHPPITRAYKEKYGDSETWSIRSRMVIAGATTHDRRGFGPFGIYVDRAKGAHKWDVSGNRLIDFWMGHGSLLMGHGFAPVVRAVNRQIERGTHYGACHPLEVRWAELVRDIIPSAGRVRFTASGTEATMLAHRIARAFTGRQKVLKFDGHFHGWHDEAMAHWHRPTEAGFNAQAVDQVKIGTEAGLNKIVKALESKEIAAVILEPGGGTSGGLPWSAEMLQTLRDATDEHGTLLIFDEVISGFRHTPGGVQQAAKVTPDITTLAKILCGGLPGGAVVGREDVMAVFGEGTRRPSDPRRSTLNGSERRSGRWARVPHTGTFNANPLSAAAGLAMLEHIRDGKPQKAADKNARAFVRMANKLAERHGLDIHYYVNGTSIYHVLIGAHAAAAPLGPSTAVLELPAKHPEKYALLRRALLVEGVDTHPIHGWISAVHDENVLDETSDAFDKAFRRLKDAACMRRP